MKRETRKMVLLNQIDLMRELVDANPEFTEDAIQQCFGMLRYSCALTDIDYEFEMSFRVIIRDYLQKSKGYRRPYIKQKS
ncbi:hypothetical protein Q5O24_13240 [Eubacteriaceae bacterium ES3]|nr:hypothetical protein Q5O24_13240 [Eubacteriaceae bacterium ES3]